MGRLDKLLQDMREANRKLDNALILPLDAKCPHCHKPLNNKKNATKKEEH